jgi:hypothetical protein
MMKSSTKKIIPVPTLLAQWYPVKAMQDLGPTSLTLIVDDAHCKEFLLLLDVHPIQFCGMHHLMSQPQ